MMVNKLLGRNVLCTHLFFLTYIHTVQVQSVQNGMPAGTRRIQSFIHENPVALSL